MVYMLYHIHPRPTQIDLHIRAIVVITGSYRTHCPLATRSSSSSSLDYFFGNRRFLSTNCANQAGLFDLFERNR